MVRVQPVPLSQFPFSRPGEAPAAEYEKLRTYESLPKVRLWDGSAVWFACRYDHVRQILRDNRFSAAGNHAHYPAVSEARKKLIAEEPLSLIRMDPPQHTAFRRMLTAEFSHPRMVELKPMISKVIALLIDRMIEAGAPTDFTKAFSLPFPSYVIAEILGVPHGQHEFFQKCTITKLALDNDPQDAFDAGVAQRDFLYRLFAEKSKDSAAQDDLIKRLIVTQIEPGNISVDQAVATVELLLIAGHETTANTASLGMKSLIENREAFERIHDDDDGIATRNIVEEILRFHSIVHFTAARVAVEDVSPVSDR